MVISMMERKKKRCIYCERTDRQAEINDNFGIFLNFNQWAHPDCREKLKDKTAQ